MKEDKKRQTLDEKRIEKVAFELGLPKEIVAISIKTLITFMKSKIEEPDLKNLEILSKEEFDLQVPIVKIPHLGFLVPSYGTYLNINKSKNK